MSDSECFWGSQEELMAAHANKLGHTRSSFIVIEPLVVSQRTIASSSGATMSIIEKIKVPVENEIRATGIASIRKLKKDETMQRSHSTPHSGTRLFAVVQK